jgi:hypothetical protein
VRHMPVLEGAVVARIMADLKKRPGVVVRKRHGTAMGVAGDPDLYGTVRGRHFEIEVKRPNDRSSQLTKLQTQRLLEWKLAGAITGVARSVEDALVILGLAQPETHPEPPARCPISGQTRFEEDGSNG